METEAQPEFYPNPAGLEVICNGVFKSKYTPDELINQNTGSYISHLDFHDAAETLGEWYTERTGNQVFLKLLLWQVDKFSHELANHIEDQIRIPSSDGSTELEDVDYFYLSTQLIADTIWETSMTEIDIKDIGEKGQKVLKAVLFSESEFKNEP